MYSDITRYRQIFLNVLSNACKFTRDGEVSVFVDSVVDTTDSKCIRCIVKDTGIGISKKQLKNIFEPFQQADLSTTKEFGGTGLGLTITKTFVDKLGGSINVVSEDGFGTEFTIVIPVQITKEKLARLDNINKDPRKIRWGKENATNGRRNYISKVLVIDDDPAIGELATRYLTDAGFYVESKETGESGLLAAKEWQPDIILLDVMLPHIDGWSVLKRLSEDKNTMNIPVIMISMLEEKEFASSHGVATFFKKPIQWHKVLESIRIQLRNNNKQIKNAS